MSNNRSFLDLGLSLWLFLVGFTDLAASVLYVLLFFFGVITQPELPQGSNANFDQAFRMLGIALGFIVSVLVLAQGLIVSAICFSLQRILHHVSNR